jgi:hypothetical protein
MQLEKRLFFNERALYEASLWHAQKVEKLLQTEQNIFFESFGASIYFRNLHYAGDNKRYTYLLRHLDFSISNVGIRDFLIPMQALGSQEFWKQKDLLEVLGIKSSSYDFFEHDIARCIADMIKNSINNTCIHFEAHMQNMTLHVRKGKAVKFIYHDLQDVMFDPIIYFCNQLLKVGIESNGQLNAVVKKVYGIIDDMQLTRTLNAQGERVNDTKKGYESYTVVSFWRKYIRNLGDFTRIYNFFKGDDYFLGRRFEEALLRHLNFSAHDLGFDIKTPEDKQTMHHLFWCLDRYYTRQNEAKVDEVFRLLQNFIVKEERIPFKDFFFNLQNYQYVASSRFPTRPEFVNKDLISDIVDLHDKKVFLFHYDSKPVILIKLSYPTDNFEFGQ